MAGIDYQAIRAGVRAALQADPALAGVAVDIEREFPWTTPWVGVYLERRDAAPEAQALAAGTRTRYLVRLSLWCVERSLESLERAVELRDDLLSRVEVALMRDRTLAGAVAASWLEGGEMPSGRDPEAGGYLSGAEVRLVADATASTG
ncbi:MAG: hypothetical protein HY521_14995 [Proteobacteria bacterium]|nr:hypothetical protein [Pseudomonadota bacterium]